MAESLDAEIDEVGRADERTGDDYERKRREGVGPDVSCGIILGSISHYGLNESVCLKSKKGW